MDWSAIRNEFPALRHFTYLNTATYGHVPLRSQIAVTEHFRQRDRTACTDFMRWFDDADEVRESIGRLIRCEAADIAFIHTSAAALSLFLGGIDWQPGDKILTLKDEFPNQYYYARWLGSRGVELIETDAIEAIPARTRAVVLSTVNYTSGYRPDVGNIAGMAHAAGALLYVDGTQSIGAIGFDLQSARPDMMACDPYKWLMAPNGATFFYISPEFRPKLAPSVFGWRSDKGWRGVDDLHHGAPELPDGAEKYEGGMLNFPSLYGLRESLKMVHEIGVDVIERRVLQLAAMACEVLRSAGAEIAHDASNIVAARFRDRDASELARTLAEQNVVVAARHGNLRVSPHFYNDESDLEILARSLDPVS